MVAWGFGPDRQFDDPALENMLLRIEEMQVSAVCRILILTTQTAWKRSPAIELVFTTSSAVVSCSVMLCLLFVVFDLMGNGSLQAGGQNSSYICFLVSEQREQDEVRRRCASIMYSDPLFSDAAGATGKT